MNYYEGSGLTFEVTPNKESNTTRWSEGIKDIVSPEVNLRNLMADMASEITLAQETELIRVEEDNEEKVEKIHPWK